MNQLAQDTQLLQDMSVMDYSLLVGISFDPRRSAPLSRVSKT